MYTKYRHLELNLMAMKINCAKPKKKGIKNRYVSNVEKI